MRGGGDPGRWPAAIWVVDLGILLRFLSQGEFHLKLSSNPDEYIIIANTGLTTMMVTWIIDRHYFSPAPK